MYSIFFALTLQIMFYLAPGLKYPYLHDQGDCRTKIWWLEYIWKMQIIVFPLFWGKSSVNGKALDVKLD